VVKELSLVELFIMGRFTLVGILATILHISIAWLLITLAGLYPITANFMAFLCAFMLSFSGHYYWTFYSRVNRAQALRRFFVISGTAILVNNIALMGLLKADFITPVLATICAAFLIPIFTYVLSRLWVFRG
jgi:putative flippase GtrA